MIECQCIAWPACYLRGRGLDLQLTFTAVALVAILVSEVGTAGRKSKSSRNQNSRNFADELGSANETQMENVDSSTLSEGWIAPVANAKNSKSARTPPSVRPKPVPKIPATSSTPKIPAEPLSPDKELLKQSLSDSQKRARELEDFRVKILKFELRDDVENATIPGTVPDEAIAQITGGRKPGLPPSINALLGLLVTYLDVDFKSKGNESNGNVAAIVSGTLQKTSQERYRAIIRGLKMIHEIYSLRAESFDRPIKSGPEALHLIEPTMGVTSDITKNIEAALNRFQSGEMRIAISENLLREGQLKFETQEGEDLATNYQGVRDLNRDFLVDMMGSGGGNKLGSSFLVEVFKSIIVSLTSSTSAIKFTTQAGAEITRVMARNMSEEIESENSAQPKTLAGRMISAADKVEYLGTAIADAHEMLIDEASIMTAIEGLIVLAAKDFSLVATLFGELEKNLRDVLRRQLHEMPERAFLAFSGEAVAKHLSDLPGYSSGSGDSIELKVLKLGLLHYLPELPVGIQKNILYDLMTFQPNADDVEFIAILIRRWGPLVHNIMQHLLEGGKSEVSKVIAGAIQTKAPYPTHQEVWDVYQNDVEDFDFLFLPNNMPLGEKIARAEERWNENKKPLLVNLRLFPMDAATVASVHATYFYDPNSKSLLPYIAKVLRPHSEETIQMDHKILKGMNHVIADILVSPITRRASSTFSVDRLLDFLSESKVGELDLVSAAEIQIAGSMRLSRRLGTGFGKEPFLINDENVDIETAVPSIRMPKPGSQILLMDFIEKDDFKEFVRYHPERYQAIGKALDRIVYDELFFRPLEGHPLLVKTSEYAKSVGLEFEVDWEKGKFNLGQSALENEAELSAAINTQELFGYEVGIKTFGEHVHYLNKGYLADGFVQADAHPGNILISEDGKKVFFIDFGMKAILPRELMSPMIALQIAATRGKILGAIDEILKLCDFNPSKTDVIKRKIRVAIDDISDKNGGQVLTTGELIHELGMFHEIPIKKSLLSLHYPLQSVRQLYSISGNGPKEDAEFYQKQLKPRKDLFLKTAGYGYASRCVAAWLKN